MPRWVVLGLTLAIGGLFLGSEKAQSQPIDSWHYIDADSVLHTERVDGLHGAGVIQSDQIFAMLYLGLPEGNGVVSVVLPTLTAMPTLSSTLIAPNGQRFVRVLEGSELDVSQVSDTSYAYSFSITSVDVALYKSARSWELSQGESRWTVTLAGSRRAIEEAETEHRHQFKKMSETRPTTAAVQSRTGN